jgi:hypothetical protein
LSNGLALSFSSRDFHLFRVDLKDDSLLSLIVAEVAEDGVEEVHVSGVRFAWSY